MNTIHPAPSIQEALITVLSKYTTFTGRARRAEFWKFGLATLIIAGIAGLAASLWGLKAETASNVLDVLLFLPSLAVTARRLHDIGRSGWWLLIGLTGIGCLVLFYWTLLDSHEGTNEYGDSPKYDDYFGGGEDVMVNPEQLV